MALRLRYSDDPGLSLKIGAERMSDKTYLDFSTASGTTVGTFTANPVTPLATFSEGTGRFAGQYVIDLLLTPSNIFTDGDYCITVHNALLANATRRNISVLMFNGDDATSRAGFSLAATGLDAVSTAPAAGVPSNFREYLIATIRRLVGPGKVVKDPAAGAILHVANDLNTVIAKQSFTTVNGAEVLGPMVAPGGSTLPTGTGG